MQRLVVQVWLEVLQSPASVTSPPVIWPAPSHLTCSQSPHLPQSPAFQSPTLQSPAPITWPAPVTCPPVTWPAPVTCCRNGYLTVSGAGDGKVARCGVDHITLTCCQAKEKWVLTHHKCLHGMKGLQEKNPKYLHYYSHSSERALFLGWKEM